MKFSAANSLQINPDLAQESTSITKLGVGRNTKNINIIDQFKNLQILEFGYLTRSTNEFNTLFRKICTLDKLQELKISHFKGNSFEGIENLKNIMHLYLGECTRVISLFSLGKLFNLEWLILTGFLKTKDISPLSLLKKLKKLTLYGCANLSKISINTLYPLISLHDLEYLEFGGITHDTSIKFLSDLKKLQTLVLHYDSFSVENYAYLKVNTPQTQCDMFNYIIFDNIKVENRYYIDGSVEKDVWLNVCKKCGSPLYSLVGKRFRKVCKTDDAKIIEEHKNIFEKLVALYEKEKLTI